MCVYVCVCVCVCVSLTLMSMPGCRTFSMLRLDVLLENSDVGRKACFCLGARSVQPSMLPVFFSLKYKVCKDGFTFFAKKPQHVPCASTCAV